MNIPPNFLWTGCVRKWVLIPLLIFFLSGSLALAQDSVPSTGLKIDPEYLVLVTTLGNLLKVRQQPTVSSTVVGRVANESKLPLVTTENEANGKGSWFQVEYAQGKFGWVSGDYSKKIRTAQKTEPSKIAQQVEDSQAPITELKIDPEYLVLITTRGNTLKVRQQPTVSSPVVGRVAKGSKLPLVTTENAANGKGAWFQVEYAQGKFGWVSGDYSKKIRTAQKTEPSKVAQQETSIEPPAQDEKPVVTNTKTQKSSARPSEPVTETVTEPAQKKEVKAKKPWAKIDGFRSAKFGMRMQKVRKAIYQDFKLQDKKISIVNHPTQQTKSLAITVNNLLPNSGDSRIVYVFGYRSKKLTHVNILTGFPVDKKISAQKVVNSGNFLGNHLFKKRYQKDGFVAHAKLNDGSVLIFRGKDQKGRMVLLRLSNPQPNKNNKDTKVTLNLSYIEKPGQPDTFVLKEGDF